MCNDTSMCLVRITVQEDYCGSNSPATRITCVEVYYSYVGTKLLSMSLIIDVQGPINGICSECTNRKANLDINNI